MYFKLSHAYIFKLTHDYHMMWSFYQIHIVHIIYVYLAIVTCIWGLYAIQRHEQL